MTSEKYILQIKKSKSLIGCCLFLLLNKQIILTYNHFGPIFGVDTDSFCSNPTNPKNLHDQFGVKTNDQKARPKIELSKLPFIKFIRNISRTPFEANKINNYIYIGEVVPDYSDVDSFQADLSGGQSLRMKLVLIVIYYMNKPEDNEKEIEEIDNDLLPTRIEFFEYSDFKLGEIALFKKESLKEKFVIPTKNYSEESGERIKFAAGQIIERCKDESQSIIPEINFEKSGKTFSISTKKSGTENCQNLKKILHVFSENCEISFKETLKTFADGAFDFFSTEDNASLNVGKKDSLLKGFFDMEEKLLQVYRETDKSLIKFDFYNDTNEECHIDDTLIEEKIDSKEDPEKDVVGKKNKDKVDLEQSRQEKTKWSLKKKLILGLEIFLIVFIVGLICYSIRSIKSKV